MSNLNISVAPPSALSLSLSPSPSNSFSSHSLGAINNTNNNIVKSSNDREKENEKKISVQLAHTTFRKIDVAQVTPTQIPGIIQKAKENVKQMGSVPIYRPLKVPSDQKIFSQKRKILDSIKNKIANHFTINSYRMNNTKEQTLLEYVEDFRRQFVAVFPYRRPLLLNPQNECGVRKFICTSVRPTLLSFSSLYDLKEAAEFVSDFITFLPLDVPTSLPDILPSPSTLLVSRQGDCLDMANFLVSLLRGSGHNAYLVSGYAPKWVTVYDESLVVCPYTDLDEEASRKKIREEEERLAAEKLKNKYVVRPRPDHSSSFRNKRLQAEVEKERIKLQNEENAKQALLHFDSDPLLGQRVHVWVLVLKGRRELTEDVFIEPSTGTIYPVTDSPYLAIESVWNESNYWVNVQTKPLFNSNYVLSSNGATLNTNKNISNNPNDSFTFDLNNISAWEYILIQQDSTANGVVGVSGSLGRTVPVSLNSTQTGTVTSNSNNNTNDGANINSNGVNQANVGAVTSNPNTHRPSTINTNSQSSSMSNNNNNVNSSNSSQQESAATVLRARAEHALSANVEVDNSSSNNNASNSINSNNTGALSLPSSSVTNSLNSTNESGFDDRDTLDAPVSWALPIQLTRELFRNRFPLGKKTIQYRSAIVEKWQEYYEGVNGCIRKVTIYDESNGVKRGQAPQGRIIEVRETFLHRRDLLRQRNTYPLTGRVHSLFHPGLASGLASYTTVQSALRTFSFYPGARVDGMIAREELTGIKVVEKYENRDDRLIYRSLSVDRGNSNSAGGHGLGLHSSVSGSGSSGVNSLLRRPKVFTVVLGRVGEVAISKLTEKFARANDSTPAEADVRKRTHFLNEGTIRLDFHYGDLHITASRHVIDKADKLDQSETEGPAEGSLGSLLRVDPNWKERSRGEEQQMVAKLLHTEKELKVEVKEREAAMAELVSQLDSIDTTVTLTRSIYDQAYDQAVNEIAQAEESKEKENSSPNNNLNNNNRATSTSTNGANTANNNNQTQLKVDYLSPFLASFPPGKVLSRRQALQVKEECLSALKERLLERAAIIQEHLEMEQGRLHEKQANFKRTAGAGPTAFEAEEFNKFCQQCLFRIDILNARRQRHEELALKKYVEMDERLNADPRLQALHQSE